MSSEYWLYASSLFQFSDMLLYTSKGVTGTNQFKIHGHLPLHGMLVSGFKLHRSVKENDFALRQVKAIPSGQEEQSRRLLPGQWQQPAVLLAMACLQAKAIPSITLAKQREHTLLAIRIHAAERGWSGNRDLSWLFSPVRTPRHIISPSACPPRYSNGTVLSVFDLQLIVLDPPVSNKLNPAQNPPFLACCAAVETHNIDFHIEPT